MDLESRLKTHNLQTLRGEVAKHQDQLKGYSKLNKQDLISLMVRNKNKFNHIQAKSKIERASKGGRSFQFIDYSSDNALRNGAESLIEYIKNGYVLSKSNFKSMSEINEFVKRATAYYKGGGNGIVERALSMYKPKDGSYKFVKVKAEKRKNLTYQQKRKIKQREEGAEEF